MTQPDIIVIGGGIAGTSAAAMLAAEANVLQIEAEPQLGYHSTGRSAAIFIRNYGNAALRALNAASAPVLQEPTGISDRSLLSPRGEMVIADEANMPALDDYAAGSTGLEYLTPDEAVSLVPILQRALIAGAVFERDAQDIDVDRMLQGYARLLRIRGGRTVTGTAVTGLKHDKGFWHVTTPTGAWHTKVIVNAAGAWADTVAQMAGLPPIGITPMRRSAALMNVPPEYQTDSWPLFASAAESWYAKPDAGRLMISPADEDPVEAHDAWPDDMVLAMGLDRFEQAVTIPVTRPTHTWAGLRNFARDRTPVAGFDPTEDGFYWLAGQGGNGVQTAPALAALSASQILELPQTLDKATIRALAPDRFRTA
jgi:D-arginine dehydrogenase